MEQWDIQKADKIMITADEWAGNLFGTTCADKEWHKIRIEFIRHIQLDAWKQGMSDAAAILSDDHGNCRCMECGTEEFDHHKAIEQERDNKTSL